jgi:hypothetical protein
LKTLRILVLFCLALLLTTGCEKKKKSLKWVQYNCKQFCIKANRLCNNYFKKKKKKFDTTSCTQGCVKNFVKAPAGISDRLVCAAKKARTCAQMRSCNKFGKRFPNRKAFLRYMRHLRLQKLKKLQKSRKAKKGAIKGQKAPVKGKPAPARGAAPAGRKAPAARPAVRKAAVRKAAPKPRTR